MTDTTKTRDELVLMALDDLVAVGIGQSAAAEDIEKVNSRFDGFMSELAQRGICEIADEDEIPIEWTSALSELLANDCARLFGKQKMAPQDREATEDRLKIMVNNQPPSTTKLLVDPMLTPVSGVLTLARWSRGG